ncbi:phage adaptor protein [Phenylobacterium sp. VNQ135]|uniref:phage adaptor protein n=1 Tax=Phenylobacterium sp. VNQ135 TaxID=3400922 RepID=UPI003C07B715
MAITNYAELQAAAAAWLVRSDLTARILEFIALAEIRLNRVLRLRLGEVEQSADVGPGDRVVALPAGFVEPLAVWLEVDGARHPLRLVDPAIIDALEEPGRPQLCGVDGEGLAFERPCDRPYRVILRMRQRFSLSDVAPVNALIAEAPDIYLFATLCEAAPFLRDLELSNSYEARLERAIAEANARDGRRLAKSTLATELPALLVERA